MHLREMQQVQCKAHNYIFSAETKVTYLILILTKTLTQEIALILPGPNLWYCN